MGRGNITASNTPGSPSLPAGKSSPRCPACALSYAARWHFSVAGSPELPLSFLTLIAAQKISWPFARQCCICLGEGSLEGVDKKALCEGRNGAELILSLWQEGLSPPLSHRAPRGRRSDFPLPCLGLFHASSGWTWGLCKALHAF